MEWESPLLGIFADGSGLHLAGYVQTDYSAVEHGVAQTTFQVLPWHSFSWSCGKAGAGIDMLLWEGNMKSLSNQRLYSGLHCAGFYATFFVNWCKIQACNNKYTSRAYHWDDCGVNYRLKEKTVRGAVTDSRADSAVCGTAASCS